MHDIVFWPLCESLNSKPDNLHQVKSVSGRRWDMHSADFCLRQMVRTSRAAPLAGSKSLRQFDLTREGASSVLLLVASRVDRGCYLATLRER